MLQKFLLLFRLRLLFGASVMLVMVMGWPQPPLWLQWTSLLLVVVTAINTLRHKRIFLSLVLILGFTNMALLGIEQMLELPENLRIL